MTTTPSIRNIAKESPKSAEFTREINVHEGKLNELCEQIIRNAIHIDIEQEEMDKKKRELEEETGKTLEETGEEKTGRGRNLLKFIVSTFDVNVTADLNTSPMRDLAYDEEKRTLLNKREDFEYILNHFHVLTGRSEVERPDLEHALDDHVDDIAGICEEFMGGGRRLTDEERARLKTFIEKQLTREEEMDDEMERMTPLEWRAWDEYLGHRKHEPSRCFYCCPLDYRIKVWEDFVIDELEWYT
ncbi:hypothetical protein HK104_011396 [Borealophlyctis nickersoniae]|nr:hypothetical protein HK104_011396 [Borealophlyctis nickersoniae]